jgi:hypothetical protein
MALSVYLDCCTPYSPRIRESVFSETYIQLYELLCVRTGAEGNLS